MGFVERPTCQLPELVDADTVAAAGDSWTCPDCGLVWTASWQAIYGGRPQPAWTCATTTAGSDS